MATQETPAKRQQSNEVVGSIDTICTHTLLPVAEVVNTTNVTASVAVDHRHLLGVTLTNYICSSLEREIEEYIRSPLESAIANCFRTPSVAPYDDSTSHLYKIDDVFGKPYWNELPSDRFKFTNFHGVLYRPDIVNEIVPRIEKELRKTFCASGLMIKGPYGSGKSHSIVNVVRKLQSTGNYLVTFIPDCKNWTTSYDLIEAICLSIGTSAEAHGIRKAEEIIPTTLMKLIDDVTKALKALGKQWIFVFDQINHLYARFPDRKYMSSFPFPFYLVEIVMVNGRITTIISVSSDNEIPHKCIFDRTNFLEYTHRTDMTIEELKIVHPGTTDFEEQLTGYVPLFVRELLCDDISKATFIESVNTDVESSLRTLMRQNIHSRSITSLNYDMCQILFGCEFYQSLFRYDKKYFIEKYNRTLKTWTYQSLSPLVEDATRIFFWNDLITYVTLNESKLLHVMCQSYTANDKRGVIFKSLLAQRCRLHGVCATIVDLQQQTVIIEVNAVEFQGLTLRHIDDSEIAEGVFIPTNGKFPVVDMVWKSGNCVYGVQVHISSDQIDVAEKFWDLCNEASWFEKYEIYLLYLSPNDNCSIKVKNQTYCKGDDRGKKRKFKQRRKTLTKVISIGYVTVLSVRCLEDLPIPKDKIFQ